MVGTPVNQRGAFVIPCYNAGDHVLAVVRELRDVIEEAGLPEVPIVVVDDGSTDGCCDELGEHVTVLTHTENRGKGTALQTAFGWAVEQGIETVVTLDADGQHPPREALRLYQNEAPAHALVLAVRDLQAAGAPRANQLSNAFSNFVLSAFGGTKLEDTQCGLRRYPVKETLALGATHPGYPFESELVLRAARKGLRLVHVKTDVHYPKGEARLSHFDSVRDPAKNVVRVVTTTMVVPHHRASRRWARRVALLLVGVGLAWFVLK